MPEYVRSDNGADFVAKELMQRLRKIGTGAPYIEPGSRLENPYCARCGMSA